MYNVIQLRLINSIGQVVSSNSGKGEEKFSPFQLNELSLFVTDVPWLKEKLN